MKVRQKDSALQLTCCFRAFSLVAASSSSFRFAARFSRSAALASISARRCPFCAVAFSIFRSRASFDSRTFRSIAVSAFSSASGSAAAAATSAAGSAPAATAAGVSSPPW
eukprot:SAG22_NODE_4661_length_1201_cov_1.605263_2_plen_110_part_00